MSASQSVGKGLQDTQCPAGPFETDPDRLSKATPREAPPVASEQSANDAIPTEIARIGEGAVSLFHGGLMNEGTTTWYAFDVERRLFVAVLTSTGSKRAPSADKLTKAQLLRYTDAAGYRRAEYVTVAAATVEQARTFACLANTLLATEPDAGSRPTPPDTVAKSFSLIHEGKPLQPGNWGLEGELERFISGPLQETILQAL